MNRKRFETMTLLVTAALTLGACGVGGDGDGERLTKEQYIEQGNAICAEASARIDAAAQSAFSTPREVPPDEEVVELATETVVPAIEEEVESLSELRPPEFDDERVEQTLQAGRDGVDTVRRDPTIIRNSNDDGFARYRELSESYGLQDCGGGSDVLRDSMSGFSGGS
jgi:hypothetical protein